MERTLIFFCLSIFICYVQAKITPEGRTALEKLTKQLGDGEDDSTRFTIENSIRHGISNLSQWRQYDLDNAAYFVNYDDVRRIGQEVINEARKLHEVTPSAVAVFFKDLTGTDVVKHLLADIRGREDLSDEEKAKIFTAFKLAIPKTTIQEQDVLRRADFSVDDLRKLEEPVATEARSNRPVSVEILNNFLANVRGSIVAKHLTKALVRDQGLDWPQKQKLGDALYNVAVGLSGLTQKILRYDSNFIYGSQFVELGEALLKETKSEEPINPSTVSAFLQAVRDGIEHLPHH